MGRLVFTLLFVIGGFAALVSENGSLPVAVICFGIAVVALLQGGQERTRTPGGTYIPPQGGGEGGGVGLAGTFVPPSSVRCGDGGTFDAGGSGGDCGGGGD